MHEDDQDPYDLGDLPEDLSEFMNEDYLLGTNLFDEVWLNGEESSSSSDSTVAAELQCSSRRQRRQEEKLRDRKLNRRKRLGGTQSQSQQAGEENTPSGPKRHKAAVTITGLELSPAETTHPITTPTRILHLHPSIQLITIPDTPGYQVVRTLELSPPVVRLPLSGAVTSPTYILVPPASPSCKCQGQPLSPVDGAVAPVQMSSSPSGSLSDTASRVMSPHDMLPLSPATDTSSNPECPWSPAVPDIPQVTKDYIQEVKAHMSHTCLDLSEGLTLTSHFVDMQVSQRETLHSGKSPNKGLDKELSIMGDTDRQKNLLGHSQIFMGGNGNQSKRYILLLGNASMGKTTLIRKLCHEWSTNSIPQFDFVFLLDRKALSLTKSVYSLQTLLLNHSSFIPPCMDPEAVYAQILAAPKRVLIIFDGFDELRVYETLLQTQDKDVMTSLQKGGRLESYSVRQLYSAILQRVLLQGCTLLLTSRPRGTASQLLRRVDSILEVCGFTPSDIETYLFHFFTDPGLRAPALDRLKNCSYLHHLCWNPGLCRLVCLVLEKSKSGDVLPRTLTELCHRVLCLKLEKGQSQTRSPGQTETALQSEKETQTQSSGNIQFKGSHKQTPLQCVTRSRRQSVKKHIKKENEVDPEEFKRVGGEPGGTEERELLAQLSSLAWEGVKANASILPTWQCLSDNVKDFGFFESHHLKTIPVVPKVEGGGREEENEQRGKEDPNRKGNRGWMDIENGHADDDCVVFWANPFLQSYLAGVHLSLSRKVSDRIFLQMLPFQSGARGRRRPLGEELDLTQRFAFSLLLSSRTELQRLHSFSKKSFKDIARRQALVAKHLKGLSNADLSRAQVLEACHWVYDASFTHGNYSMWLVSRLAENLSFRGVPLRPPDVFAVQNILDIGGNEGRRFCLDLEDTGIQVSGLRALVGLDNINTYRACIADVMALWEQLEECGEEELLRLAVSRFKIHPLKITQVYHVDHLTKLVDVHVHRRLSGRCSQTDSILAEGVPAVKELHRLEFEIGPDKGPQGLQQLWELLPGLQNLQRLDLENSKIGDSGSEKLADALMSLSSLEILNLPQNCIGDKGVKKLAPTLTSLPKLHCLSLYSNVISDDGAESLAAVLPRMSSLVDLDVTYNRLTDIGAQSLGASLRNCQRMKTLRLWNQCIPYGAFERLQQQDSRILWH